MRVSRTLTLALGAALALGACGDDTLPPQGQVVLVLDADAPLARPAKSTSPTPLFDRVLIDIFPPDKPTPCDGCSREIPIDVEKVRSLRFSFGWVPPPRVIGYKARLRLFRFAGRGTPRPTSTIELVGYLPAVAEEGITTLTATFHAEDVGKPRGTLTAPIVFDNGVPAASAEGTWPGARVVDCTGRAPPTAVCIPGGAFFMGDPRVSVTEEFMGGAAEHLVVLSPFFLDAKEVTVEALRASGLAEINSRGLALDPRDDTRDDLGGVCDYTSSAGAWEDRPVNCVSWQLARKFCQTRGGDLPTEAQTEFVASVRGTSLAPWGNREPTCKEAVIKKSIAIGEGGCDPDPLVVGARILPERAGSGSLDRVAQPSGVVLDLGANLSEWTRDAFAQDGDACWSGLLLRDPVCDPPGAKRRSCKGSDLERTPVDYMPVRRACSAQDTRDQYANVGFRCAYPVKN